MKKRFNSMPRGFLDRSILLILGYLFLPAVSMGMPANPKPVEVMQSDGAKVKLILRGDEFHHWHEDESGYTVLKDTSTNNWVYAERDAKGSLRPGKYKAGVNNPASLGFLKHYMDSDKVRRATELRNKRDSSSAFHVFGSRTVTGARVSAAPAKTPILTGTMKNLVILAEFPDIPHTHTQAEFDALFNQAGYATDHALGSVKDYYHEVSYNNLTVQSVVTQWVTLPHNHDYYGANTAGQGTDIDPQQMVIDAINALAATGFNFTTVDGNGDGMVDGLDIIHSGRGEEWGGNDPNYIWSHEWELDTPVTKQGKTMQMYHTEPEVRGWDDDNTSWGLTRIGTICHETGHFLGLPDLYDTTGASAGIGAFCLMSGGSWNGPSDNGASPAHMSAWCKKTLGWATPAQLTMIGTDSLPRIEDNSGAMYMLQDASFPSTEYFLVENRQGYGFDAYLPGSSRGILVWHVDESMPDNSDKTHYLVDLEEAHGGVQILQTDPNATGEDSDYFRYGNKTIFGDSTDPNSKSYGGKNLKLLLKNISATGNPMSFDLGSTDTTPPANIAVVNDGLTADISITGSLTQLSANWTASSDSETGLYGYWYAIGTSQGANDVAGWTFNGTGLSGQFVTKTGLNLISGTTYYFGVKAENGVGLYSAVTWSNGQRVDLGSPTDIPYVNDGTGADIQYVSSLNTLSANWGASTYTGGSIDHYEYCIGTTPGAVNVAGWTSVGGNRAVTKTGLSLTDGNTYYFGVQAFTAVGHSGVALSDGQQVDVTSPTAKVIITSALPARPGAFSAKLIVNEANGLAGAPALKIAPGCGAAYNTALSWVTLSTWTVSSFIETYFSTGAACFVFSAADLAGNTGTVITSGGSFDIDTSISGAAGGTVANSDGFGVTVPAGDVSGNFFVTISTVAASLTDSADALSPGSVRLRVNDLVRDFSAKDALGGSIHSFSAPLTITLPYSDADADGRIDGDNIRVDLAWIYWLDEASGRWTPVAGTAHNTAANTLTAAVNHFSLYSIRAQASSALTLANLKAYPNPCDFNKTPYHLTIVGIPTDETAPAIYIYNSAGELVRVLKRGAGIDPLNEASWDGRGKGGGRAASGLYIYMVRTEKYGNGSGKFFVSW
ncbi:MAG: M6 family metalloprotease domain-containing protein [Elusimicrobia bacterium]|nr:M6 family metalloprotease domain-containing protein [Elusimicrobiota bacterium]